MLITGAAGRLGRALARACESRGLEHRLLSRIDLDVTDERAVDAVLARFEPWAIVNAAGSAPVDAAALDVAACWRDNVEGAATLALAAAARGLPLVIFSSHAVFDGELDRPYVETDVTTPIGVFGACKAHAEARGADAAHPVGRTPLRGRTAAVDELCRSASAGAIMAESEQ